VPAYRRIHCTGIAAPVPSDFAVSVYAATDPDGFSVPFPTVTVTVTPH